VSRGIGERVEIEAGKLAGLAIEPAQQLAA